ncbi:hypothetical protein BZG20_00015 [Salinivibrio sp. IB868]|uniref:hypothetical protein n=1 Tax=unclassified Salinivibrio TaxID=2636825 RepID=UPI000986A2E1|nr:MULTISPECIES: hypothetical protein [unclassified Salinivibrio]OOE69362.1 hypothetical protein BZG20_00015 [Salinivibrio sp. IB868]OOE76706.1 hypothetical protein BZG22_03860 [Salinivibrio sp. IB870]
MRLIGIRNDHAIVKFVDGYAHFVESNVEKRESGLYPSKVIFSGLGTTSVIEIDGVRFVVPNEKYNMIIDRNILKLSD